MWSLIGNAAAIAALERALAAEPAHAYLLVGPAGVGKATAALEFAAALNCTGLQDNQPCGKCRACRDTLASRHTDVEQVAPGGICDEPDHRDHADSRNLRICQVRRLERVLSLAPYAGKRRVAIVDAADTLQTEAANAFLKTLEEPPAGTVIVLLAENEERLPETVRSRCQRIPFRLADRDEIVAALRARGAEPEQADTIASLAGGRVGWALRALADDSLLAERTDMLSTAVRVAHGGRTERFAWAREAEGRSNGMRERYLRELDVWESWWRDVLAAGAGASGGFVNHDREQELAAEGKLYSAGAIVTFLRSLSKTREYLHANVDAQLALENLMLDLPRPSAGGRV
jgi:DNA polymerase-3 subunit delta'